MNHLDYTAAAIWLLLVGAAWITYDLCWFAVNHLLQPDRDDA